MAGRMRLDAPAGSKVNIPQEFEHAISLKEGKLPLYRKKNLDQYWLLLYTENPGRNHLNRIYGMQVTSDYHRVFIIQLPNVRSLL